MLTGPIVNKEIAVGKRRRNDSTSAKDVRSQDRFLVVTQSYGQQNHVPWNGLNVRKLQDAVQRMIAQCKQSRAYRWGLLFLGSTWFCLFRSKCDKQICHINRVACYGVTVLGTKFEWQDPMPL